MRFDLGELERVPAEQARDPRLDERIVIGVREVGTNGRELRGGPLAEREELLELLHLVESQEGTQTRLAQTLARGLRVDLDAPLGPEEEKGAADRVLGRFHEEAPREDPFEARDDGEEGVRVGADAVDP